MWDTWPCAIFSFIRSKEITDRDLVNLFKCVYEHGLRLRTRYTVSNWLIMEMNGLIHISLFFPFFKPAKEWEAFAAEILTRQLLEQVYPDGFQQELTTNYHQVVLTNYEGVLRAYAKKGIKPPEELLSALEKMYDVYLHIVMPNMITPNLNDGADLSMSEALGTAVKLLPERQDLLYLQSGRQKGQPPSFTSTMRPMPAMPLCAVIGAKRQSGASLKTRRWDLGTSTRISWRCSYTPTANI